jgi:hypothetical protein
MWPAAAVFEQPRTLAALPAPCVLSSADRKPDEFVFLVVRKSANGPWQFPQAAHSAGETVRQVRCGGPAASQPGS